MRILFAAEAEMNEVSGIASALRARAGVRVALGTTLFWDVWRCDVCHLFWPNARMALEPIDETLTRLDQRLLRVREQAMIVVSRRNPPIGTPRTEERQRLEHTLYRRAHAIVHPGPGSRDELSLRYPRLLHRVIPVACPADPLPPRDSIAAMRRALGLDDERPIVACFAESFAIESLERLVTALARTDGIAPQLLLLGTPRPESTSWSDRTALALRLGQQPRVVRCANPIDARERQRLLAVAELVLLAPEEILSSDTMALAFAAGRVVVGSAAGCVGAWLEECGNATYADDDADGLAHALEAGWRAWNSGVGEANRARAVGEWSIERVATAQLDLYRELTELK